jgi:hypothetical protein
MATHEPLAFLAQHWVNGGFVQVVRDFFAKKVYEHLGQRLGPVVQVHKLATHNFRRQCVQEIEQGAEIPAWVVLRGDDNAAMHCTVRDELIVQPGEVADVVRKDGIPLLRCKGDLLKVVRFSLLGLLGGEHVPTAQPQGMRDEGVDILIEIDFDGCHCLGVGA